MVSVDSTSQVHEYIFQNNQTNMEFLRERAAAVGYDLYFEDGTLYFKRPFQTRGTGTTLTYGQDLVRFTAPALSAKPGASRVCNAARTVRRMSFAACARAAALAAPAKLRA